MSLISLNVATYKQNTNVSIIVSSTVRKSILHLDLYDSFIKCLKNSK